MPVCMFCEQSVNKLCDSHIIPKSFFRYMESLSNSDEPFIQVSNSKNKLPMGRIRQGWYDKDLVCQKCEKLFGPYDLYADKILIKNEKKHKELKSAYIVEKFDYKSLKLFFISTLWRAGASRKQEFRHIMLGPYLDQAKQSIETKSAGNEDFFSVILARFEDVSGKQFMPDPHEEKRSSFGGIRVYRFYLGAGYVFYIKVDKRPFLGNWGILALSPVRPLYILKRGKFSESKEIEVMKKVFFQAQDNLNSLKTR